jgi:hypothetical protein
MSTRGTLTRDAVVDALIAQLAMRRLQNTVYQRLAQRMLGASAQPRQPHILPVFIAARAKTAA